MKIFTLGRRFGAHAILFSAFIVSSGLAVDVAMAKEHAVKNHSHDRDFYALSNVGEAVDHTAVHHSNCFMTSTAAEAARGIRHWNGSC